jgi:hypothetical protein
MAKTLASQAKDGGSIPLARFVGVRRCERAADRRPGGAAGGYQACSVPQWGQSTEVDTVAMKAKPHMQA